MMVAHLRCLCRAVGLVVALQLPWPGAAQVAQVNCCEFPYAPEVLGLGGCVGSTDYHNTVRGRARARARERPQALPVHRFRLFPSAGCARLPPAAHRPPSLGKARVWRARADDHARLTSPRAAPQTYHCYSTARSCQTCIVSSEYANQELTCSHCCSTFSESCDQGLATWAISVIVVVCLCCCCSMAFAMTEKRRRDRGMTLAEAYHITSPLARAVTVGDGCCANADAGGDALAGGGEYGGPKAKELADIAAVESLFENSQNIPVATASLEPAHGVPVPHGHIDGDALSIRGGRHGGFGGGSGSDTDDSELAPGELAIAGGLYARSDDAAVAAAAAAAERRQATVAHAQPRGARGGGAGRVPTAFAEPVRASPPPPPDDDANTGPYGSFAPTRGGSGGAGDDPMTDHGNYREPLV